MGPNQSLGSCVEEKDNFLVSMRWLGCFKIYPEVGLESASFIGWYPPFPNVFRQLADIYLLNFLNV